MIEKKEEKTELSTRHHIGGPYWLIPSRGLTVDREPTQQEAEDMLDWLAAYDESALLLWAYYLASLPKDYGRTFNKAVDIFSRSRGTRPSQSWIDDLRSFGKKCPPHKYDPRWTLTHHMTLYVYYDLSDLDRQRYFDLLEESLNSPGANGHYLSVSDLRERIKKDKGLLPELDSTPEDKEYDLVLQNYELQGDLFAERSKTSLVAETLEQDIFPVLEELVESGGALPDKLIEALERVKEYVDQTPKTGRSPWSILRREGGGYEIMYRLEDLGFMYLHESKFPQEGVQDLVKRLNAEVK